MKNLKEVDIFIVNATPEVLEFLHDLPNLERIALENNLDPQGTFHPQLLSYYF